MLVGRRHHFLMFDDKRKQHLAAAAAAAAAAAVDCIPFDLAALLAFALHEPNHLWTLAPRASAFSSTPNHFALFASQSPGWS